VKASRPLLTNTRSVHRVTPKLLEIKETLKGVRIGLCPSSPRQNPQGSTTLQEVDQMG